MKEPVFFILRPWIMLCGIFLIFSFHPLPSVNCSGSLYIQIYCLVWFFPPHLPPESRGSTRSYYIGCATSVVCYCFNKEMKWLLPKISVCSLFPLSHLFFDQVARSLFLLLFHLVILYEMILCVLRPSSCLFQKG